MLPILAVLAFFATSPVQILHLRADTGVVLDANGRVKLWKDLSPRHTDFRTSALGNPQLVFLTANYDTAEKRVYKTLDSDSLLRPRLVLDGIGGHPAVAFDGAQTLVDTSSLPLDSGFTLFIVAQDSTGPGRSAVLLDKGLGDFNTDLPNGWDNSIDGNFNISISWVQNIAMSSFVTSAPTLYESSWSGSTGTLWANGQFLVSGGWEGAIARNKSTWLAGVLNPDGLLQNFMKGRIAEVVVYADSLSTAERKNVESSLMAKYGIQSRTASLPTRSVFANPSVRFLHNGLEITAVGEGRVCIRNMDGRLVAQAQLSNGRAILPRVHGSLLVSVYTSGRIHSQLLVDPSR